MSGLSLCARQKEIGGTDGLRHAPRSASEALPSGDLFLLTNRLETKYNYDAAITDHLDAEVYCHAFATVLLR